VKTLVASALWARIPPRRHDRAKNSAQRSSVPGRGRVEKGRRLRLARICDVPVLKSRRLDSGTLNLSFLGGGAHSLGEGETGAPGPEHSGENPEHTHMQEVNAGTGRNCPQELELQPLASNHELDCLPEEREVVADEPRARPGPAGLDVGEVELGVVGGLDKAFLYLVRVPSSRRSRGSDSRGRPQPAPWRPTPARGAARRGSRRRERCRRAGVPHRGTTA